MPLELVAPKSEPCKAAFVPVYITLTTGRPEVSSLHATRRPSVRLLPPRGHVLGARALPCAASRCTPSGILSRHCWQRWHAPPAAGARARQDDARGGWEGQKGRARAPTPCSSSALLRSGSQRDTYPLPLPPCCSSGRDAPSTHARAARRTRRKRCAAARAPAHAHARRPAPLSRAYAKRSTAGFPRPPTPCALRARPAASLGGSHRSGTPADFGWGLRSPGRRPPPHAQGAAVRRPAHSARCACAPHPRRARRRAPHRVQARYVRPSA